MSSVSISLQQRVPPGGPHADKTGLPHYEFIGGAAVPGRKHVEDAAAD